MKFQILLLSTLPLSHKALWAQQSAAEKASRVAQCAFQGGEESPRPTQSLQPCALSSFFEVNLSNFAPMNHVKSDKYNP
jgi:hypothetical protein